MTKKLDPFNGSMAVNDKENSRMPLLCQEVLKAIK